MILPMCISMEQKKQLLIKVLKKLQPYRNLADGVLALVESSYVDEQAIDSVIHLISQSIKTAKTKSDKAKLQKWLERIQQIKAMEEDEKMDDNDLENLLADI